MGFLSGLMGGQTKPKQAYQMSDADISNDIANQRGLVQSLQAQAAGVGPSVADAYLKSAADKTAQNAAALAASSRGTNPALALRQAQQAGSDAMQNAAQQGVQAKMQEQLNGQQALGSLVNTMTGQGLQSQQANASMANQVNMQNSQNAQSASGGLLGGIGSFLGLALGGKVGKDGKPMMAPRKKMADGGSADIPSMPATPSPTPGPSMGGGGKDGAGGNGILGMLAPLVLAAADGGAIPAMPAPLQMPKAAGNPFQSNLFGGQKSSSGGSDDADDDSPAPAANAPHSMIGQAVAKIGAIPDKIGSAIGGIGDEIQNIRADLDPSVAPAGMPDRVTGGPAAMSYARGGKVPVLLSPGEKYLTPEQARAVAAGKKSTAQVGKVVPGKANVPGDSRKNDTYPTSLSPGGVVIPRTKMASSERSKADFVRQHAAKHKRLR